MMRRRSVTAHVERKSDPLKWEKLLTEQHSSVSLGSIRANLSTELHSYTSDVTEKLCCGILNYLFILTDTQIYSERSESFPGSKKCSAKECVRFSIHQTGIVCAPKRKKNNDWLPVSICAQYKIILLSFKALKGLAPSYLSDLLSSYIPSRS